MEVLTELARVLDVELGHLASAFTAQLKVLALTPGAPSAHEATLSLARRTDGVGRYLEEVQALAEREEQAGRRDVASTLYLRTGNELERTLSDDTRALAAYERALALANAGSEATPGKTGRPPAATHSLAAMRALDPVYARLGDVAARTRVLAQRVELEPMDDKAKAADPRYSLAELTLAAPDGALDGVRLLTEALNLDGDLARAEAVVRGAVGLHGTDEGLLDLFERIGRSPSHQRALLDALALRATLPNASQESAREAFLVAKELGDLERAEALLVSYVARPDDADLAWGYEELSKLRELRGDIPGAIDWKGKAAEAADAGEARRLRFEMARLTEGTGDLAASARIYERLFDDEPSDRAAWEPMLVAYRTAKDTVSLTRLLPRIVDQVDTDEDRGRLRLENARLLVETGSFEDAIRPLSDLVVDDPNQHEAATLLASLLERAGRKDELAELLARQIDAAKDRQDAKQVETLALRRVGLLEEENNHDEARATLYAALDWAPESRELLEKLGRRLEQDGLTSEHVEIKERLLKLAGPEDAEREALALAELRTTEGNPEGAERALELGYRVNPKSRELESRLEAAYRASNESGKLAELYALGARALDDPAGRVARLRQAAALYRDELSDYRRAADTLREASTADPTDVGVALDLALLEAKAGNAAGAVTVLTEVLDVSKEDAVQHASVLIERARLRVELGEDQGASEDLTAAARLSVTDSRDALMAGLEEVRARSEARGDAVLERGMRVELAATRAAAEDLDGARTLITELLRREPKDRDALRLLARVEERAQRWDAATVAYRRLVPLEEGDLAVDTALRLADACEHAGRLADARGALERTRIQAPNDQALRLRLERLYESVGAHRELAELAMNDAREATEPAVRCGHLKRAAALLLQDGTDTDAAIEALAEAHSLSGSDMESTLLLVDAYTIAGRTKEASDIISAEISARAGKRSPELASLYHRLARIAHATGSRQAELKCLVSGMEADAQNGFVAAELATLALDLGNMDVANRALRGITLLKDPATSHIPRALAYQYLGEIAQQQGDAKRAMLLLKRAIDDDPSLETARTLLEQLRGH